MAISSHDNSYSRFVSWAKIILPLAALALLSTLFLVSRPVDPTNSIPYADVGVTDRAKEQSISAPNYSGVTKDGSAISITAVMARPSPENQDEVSVTNLQAELEIEGGGSYQLSAPTGRIDINNGYAILGGGVVITTSSGYRVTTERVNTALEYTALETGGSVKATGPAGDLEAGKMVLTRAGDDNKKSGYLLVFKNGVKLVYTPASE